MDTVLVTGGAGFLGSHLADYLIEEMGREVVVLDDLSGGFAENVHPQVRFVEGSITDHSLVDALFAEHGFRHVYHLAAYAAEGLSHFIKRFNYENNLIGSVNLINAAVKSDCDCFVFTSSIAVYGAQTPPLREEQRPAPEDSYGIAKFAVEQELAISQEMFGLEHVIFRPHNVYGPRQNLGDPYRNVVGIFMNRIMQDQALPVFGDGEQKRAFTCIADIIPALARAPEVAGARNRVFNLGTDEVHTVAELAQAVMRAMGKDAPVEHLPARKEVALAWSDHSRLVRVFGPQPRTGLAEGLAKMAAWAAEHGVRRGKPFEGIEIDKNLPPSWRASMEGGS